MIIYRNTAEVSFTNSSTSNHYHVLIEIEGETTTSEVFNRLSSMQNITSIYVWEVKKFVIQKDVPAVFGKILVTY